MRCDEAFAGAPQRKAQAEQQRQQQQNMQQANVWGGVAASFLGAVAGSAISGGIGASYDDCSSSDTFDVSDVSDGFDGGDFGGDDS
jgi:hypothetical protein